MTAATPAADGGAPAASKGPVAGHPEINWTMLLLGFAGMVVGQFMAILDIQIVAASLPQIQAGVGASADEISWIQTAYLIPEVVMIPLSGFLSRLWGTQRLFLASCAGFVLMSIATGLSSSIDTMILFRAIQGFVGGAMIPTVFAVAFTAFPPDKRVTASVVMGLIVTLAPTVGPTLGGHLTEWLSWRWLFFINVGPGLLVLFLVGRYGNFDKGDPSLAKGFDWWGLGFMAVFLMSMQFVLEEGAKNDWFDDTHILLLSVVAAIAGPIFVWRSLTYRQPIVELRAFGNRNFLVGFIMTFIVGFALFGGTFLLPLFLGRVLHYSSSEVGTTMVVSGLAMFATAPFAGRLVRKMDARILMFGGFMLCAWGMWEARLVTETWGFWEFASVQAFRGIGVMLAMIASQQVTMATLPPHMVKNASGLVNLARNVGGAFGLAILNTSLTSNTALHMTELTSAIGQGDQAVRQMLAGMTQRFAGTIDPAASAMKAIYGILQRQATTMAFGDAFALLGVMCAGAAFVTLLAQPVKAQAGAPAVGRPLMARRRGQVDEKKSEAILDAAAALFADKGLQAKMDEIAKLAGVSKQTVYNRFASKLEIAQALAAKRVEDIVAPLRTAGDPQTVLETLALTLLNRVCSADKVGSMRGVALISTEAPEIAHAIYEAGPKRSLREMAAWLAEQTRLGRLEVADPEQAAEMFSGLVLGHGHLRAMLDVPQLAPEKRAARAREAARIFVVAHAPKSSGVPESSPAPSLQATS